MVKITGERMTWHKITLDFESPLEFSEEPSTFRDYRLDVTFRNDASGEIITLPGYFAADGDAANTNATTGAIWRVNFNPPSNGVWEYEASFRTGTDVASIPYDIDPSAGRAVDFINGTSGSIAVRESDKPDSDIRAKGMILQDEGTHYLQHQGDGDYFIRGGPGIPENFLASTDFDNTPNGRHDYATHLEGYNIGDPTWDGGKGKAIIGAANYLAENGLNTVYLLTNTSGGDARDVSPWTFNAANTPKFDQGLSNDELDKFSTYDISKLSQWDIVFDHMDEKGIYKNILLQETENDQQLNGGTVAADTSLSVERMIYIREMVARFGHNNALQWNIGEENTNTEQERADQAEYLKSVDGYDHLVVVHSYPAEINQVYDPLVGNSYFDGTSFQTGARNIRREIIEYREKSSESGKKWVLAWDEDSGPNSIIEPYSNNPDGENEVILREAFWGALTAGGSGGNWYFKDTSGHSLDQNYDTFEAHASVWEWTASATHFFNNYIPFWAMSQADGLTPGNNDFVMALEGRYYVVYAPYGEATDISLDLTDQSGKIFDVFWYDPRSEGELITAGQVSGGGVSAFGDPPTDTDSDWVLLVRSVGSPEYPTPDNLFVVENQAPVAVNDTASTEQNRTIAIDVLANDSDPDGDTLTLTDVSYLGSTSIVSIRNGQIVVNPLYAAKDYRIETVSYSVTDGDGKSDSAVLKVEIGVPDDPTPPLDPWEESGPVAVDDAIGTEQNKTVMVDVLRNDGGPDGDSLTLVDVDYTGVTSLVSIVGDRIRVNPLRKFSDDRVEEITYTVVDAEGHESSAVLTVEIGDANGGLAPPGVSESDALAAKNSDDGFVFGSADEPDDHPVHALQPSEAQYDVRPSGLISADQDMPGFGTGTYGDVGMLWL
ncbi:Ig-like domain-containing protein [Amaricoccus tamworthensis]|uniref:Ig-like domain-containing protein n=1 Tax=Amaricoccus tamworthensis TaxID=57002 RepID=UPI003C7CBB9E